MRGGGGGAYGATTSGQCTAPASSPACLPARLPAPARDPFAGPQAIAIWHRKSRTLESAIGLILRNPI